MKTVTKTLPTGITTVQNKSKNGAITITIADSTTSQSLNLNIYMKVFISFMYWLFVLGSMSLLSHILSDFSTSQLVLSSPIWLFIGALYTASFIQYYHTMKI